MKAVWGSNMKSILKTTAAAALAVAVCMLSACSGSSKENTVSRESFMLDTVISITLYDTENDSIFSRVFDEISGYEDMLSIHKESSDLYRLRQNAGRKFTEVSADTAFIINKSIEYSEATDGFFDVTAGPLIELWGIGTNDEHLPKEDEIKAAVSLTDYRKIRLGTDDNEIMLSEEGMFIDLGAVAKGYIADKTKEILKASGIESAIVDLGGNICLVGTKPDGNKFSVGIQDPDSDRGEYLGIVTATDTSIVTSGTYERYFVDNGVKYHHILNPFTGYPENNSIKSVSIVTESSTDADALSTSVLLLGLEKGYEFINGIDGAEAIFVTDDNKVIVTSGLRDNFRLTSKNYSMVQ